MNIDFNILEKGKKCLVNKQHYIPCCYSKNFSNKSNLKRKSNIYKLNCSNGIISQDIVENLFISKNNRYSLLKKGERNDFIEYLFNEVESRFSESYKGIINSIRNGNIKGLNIKNIENIIVFITFMNHRYDSFYSNDSSKIRNEKMVEYSKQLYLKLMNSNIEILKAFKGKIFISSDKPLILVDTMPANLKEFTLIKETSYLYFPLNKDYCLKFSNIGKSEFKNFTKKSIINLNLENTKRINYYIFKGAIDEVFSNNKNLLRNYYKLLNK